jgi:predicted helicase
VLHDPTYREKYARNLKREFPRIPFYPGFWQWSESIREKFDTYRFADYKDKVIDLLARVTTVSVETMRVVDAMKRVSR